MGCLRGAKDEESHQQGVRVASRPPQAAQTGTGVGSGGWGGKQDAEAGRKALERGPWHCFVRR